MNIINILFKKFFIYEYMFNIKFLIIIYKKESNININKFIFVALYFFFLLLFPFYIDLKVL